MKIELAYETQITTNGCPLNSDEIVFLLNISTLSFANQKPQITSALSSHHLSLQLTTFDTRNKKFLLFANHELLCISKTKKLFLLHQNYRAKFSSSLIDQEAFLFDEKINNTYNVIFFTDLIKLTYPLT